MKAPIYESVASIHINSISMGMHASKNVYVLTILPVSVHIGPFNSSQAPVCLLIRTLAYLLCTRLLSIRCSLARLVFQYLVCEIRHFPQNPNAILFEFDV